MTELREMIDRAFVYYVSEKNHSSYLFGYLNASLMAALRVGAISPEEWAFVDAATYVGFVLNHKPEYN